MKRQPLSSPQQYEVARRKIAAADATFVELWPSMTDDDLRSLIKRRPELWNRYAGYLKGDR